MHFSKTGKTMFCSKNCGEKKWPFSISLSNFFGHFWMQFWVDWLAWINEVEYRVGRIIYFGQNGQDMVKFVKQPHRTCWFIWKPNSWRWPKRRWTLHQSNHLPLKNLYQLKRVPSIPNIQVYFQMCGEHCNLQSIPLECLHNTLWAKQLSSGKQICDQIRMWPNLSPKYVLSPEWSSGLGEISQQWSCLANSHLLL